MADLLVECSRKFQRYVDRYEETDLEVSHRKVLVDDMTELVVQYLANMGDGKYVISNPGIAETSEAGLDNLVRVIKEIHIHSIAISPLGSGRWT